MRTVRFYPASALLTVLLVLTVTGAVTIAASRVLIGSTRTATQSSGGSEADAIALQVVEEGKQLISRGLLYGVDTSGWDEGEYRQGVTASGQLGAYVPYAPQPFYRGYSDTNCSVVTASQTNTNTFRVGCPYSSLLVRSGVALTNPNENQLVLDELLLPVNNQWLILPIRRLGSSSLVLSLNSQIGQIMQTATVSYKLYPSTGCVGTATDGVLNKVNRTVTLTLGTGCTPRYLFLQANGALDKNPDRPTQRDVYLKIAPSSTVSYDVAAFVISPGYTTIEATGYVAGVTKKHTVALPPKYLNFVP